MGEWQNRDEEPGSRIARVLASGKAWTEVIAEWILAEVTRVGAPASFQQEDSQRWVRASAWGIPSPPLPILYLTSSSWLASVLS